MHSLEFCIGTYNKLNICIAKCSNRLGSLFLLREDELSLNVWHHIFFPRFLKLAQTLQMAQVGAANVQLEISACVDIFGSTIWEWTDVFPFAAVFNCRQSRFRA